MNYLSSKRLKGFIGGVIVSASFGAQALCWIDKIESSGDEVRVFLSEKYRSALWRIDRRGGGVEGAREDSSVLEFFVLREGDVAHLRSGAHDWCQISGERRNDALGINVQALSQPHGFPSTSVTRFITKSTQYLLEQ